MFSWLYNSMYNTLFGSPVVEQLKSAQHVEYSISSELACNSALEKIFGKNFSRGRPDFLFNPETGNNLELDFYDPDLKLAVDYHGRQHYSLDGATSYTRDRFIELIRRDKFKIEKCEEHGVSYVIVPYHVRTELIPDFIYNSLPERLKY